MVALAKRIVIRVNFSTAWESFRAIRLKFYIIHKRSGQYQARETRLGTEGVTLSPHVPKRSTILFR